MENRTFGLMWMDADTITPESLPGGIGNLNQDPASPQNSSLTDGSNGISGEDTSASVFYYGVNGFGITWSYFFTHVVLLVVAGVGIFLNAVALKIVSVKSPFHDASYNFISHLAMSDIFIGVICIYNVLYNLIHYKNYYECALRTGIASCIVLNSSIHLLFLTFDRFFKIMHPYKYVQFFNNEKRLKILSRCIWIFAGIFGLLPILGWRRPPINGTTYCSYFGVLEKSYLILMFSLFFVIMVVMFYCYISIVCVAWNQRRSVMDTPKERRSGYDHRNTKALWWAPTKTVIILITLYICCWTPSAVVVFLHLTDVFPPSYTDNKKGVVFAYVTSFVFLNIVANPLIYAFKIRRVKHRVRSMINNISSEARLRRKTSLDSACKDVINLSDLLKETIKKQTDSIATVLSNRHEDESNSA